MTAQTQIVPPQFASLEFKANPRPFGLSVLLQISLIAFLLFGITKATPVIVAAKHEYLVMPLSEYHPAQRVTMRAPRIAPVVAPTVVASVEAKLLTPREIASVKVREREVEAPKFVAANAPIPIAKVNVPAPPKLIHTGGFEGSSAKATIKDNPKNVQTGGFGDPNGIAGKSDRDAKLVAAHVGSFELPGGAGQGNGQSGAKGVSGTVASAGFGNGVATQSPGGNGRGGVKVGGFGDAAAAASGPARTLAAGRVTQPVEILAKPNPIYTDEARRKRIEGEVLLEVEFSAGGQLHVRRVVRGLGFGLDDAAVHAAERIRYKPAQQNGQATDTVATLHILFQLAE